MHTALSRRLGSTLPELLLLTGIVVLPACGGGGGGSGGGPPQPSVTGNGSAPSTGPGDTSAYFPVGAQDSWVFDFTTNDPSASATSGTQTATVTGTKMIGSANATVFNIVNTTRTAGPYDTYFAVSNGGVTALGNTDPTDTVSPLIVPYVQLLFPVGLGQISQLTGQNLPFGKDSNGNPITLDLTQTISNAAMETVDVPAGTFVNALKQTTSLNTTALDGTQSAQITGSDTTWYAAGVGQIKDQTSVTAGSTTIVGESDLHGYLLNGQWHGIAPSAALDASLQTSSCVSALAAVPSVSSDGTNFLVVAYGCTASDSTPRWRGVLVGPDGTVLNTVTIATPTAIGPTAYLEAASGFDGAHYLVIYEDAPGPTTLTLRSVVLGTDGSVLAGPTSVATAYAPATNGVATNPAALGFDGSRFLLIYTEGAGAAGTLPQESGIFITPGTGQTSGSAFVISQVQGGTHGSPAIAFAGTDYLVVWVDSGSSPQGLHAMRVSAAGALVDAAPIALVDLSSATLQETCCDLEPAVSFDGTNYLVAYRDPRGVTGLADTGLASVSAARVSQGGALLDGSATTPGIVVAASKSQPRGRVISVFSGGVYWLVWGTNSPSQFNATRVSTAGVASAEWSDGFTIVPATAPASTALPAIAASSAGSLLVWLETQPSSVQQSQLMGLRIYP